MATNETQPALLQDAFEWKWETLARRRRRVYKVVCECGSTRWLQWSDVKKRQTCKTCQLAQATRKSQLAHPSKLHQFIVASFNAAGIVHSEQVILPTIEGRQLVLDVMVEVAGKQIAVEIADADTHESYWHNLPGQRERDIAKRAELARRGIRTVEISPKCATEAVLRVQRVAGKVS